MDLNSLQSLLSPAGQEALQAAEERRPREQDYLAHFQVLSRRFSPELARAALETAILRLEAQAKFPFAGQTYWTREVLEQASAWEVAVQRAGRYAGLDWAADLGCSAGGDSLALAQVLPVAGIDLDPLRLGLAQANAAALAAGARLAPVSFICADLRRPLPLKPHPRAGLFFDPARRTGGRRIFSVSDYQPPLESLRAWLPDFPALGVKLSPGVKLEELAGYPAEIEFVSLRGELKEAALWFGPLRSAERRATLLPGPHTLTGDPELRLPLSEPLAYLYEPDPAVLRAGLVGTLGVALDACQLDPDIAYLTAERLQATPFARAWQVQDWFPFQLKRLRQYLRQRGIGHLTVKKRGSPLEPEELIHQLRPSGPQAATIFLTHLNGKPIVIVGETQAA